MMADFGFLLISGNPALSFGKGSVGTSTLKTIFMKKIKIISTLLLIFNSSLFFAQNEFSKWFGLSTMKDNNGRLLTRSRLQDFETEKPMEPEVKENAVDKAIDASQDKAGMEEEARPDYPDVDGDGDKEESMEKALKDKKSKKKMKKESIDSKLAEIGKEAEAVKLEAQLDFLHDHIAEKVDRVNSINEDDNLKELVDRSKMKLMQKEIKLLEKRKAKMEKLYEKSCGKKYSKQEVVDENE